MEIITSHQNIDFDGLACMLAAKKIYPRAKLILPNTIENNVHDFLKIHPEIKDEFSVLTPIVFNKVNLLILVDTQHSERIGALVNLLNNKDIKIHIYDHHPKDSDSLHSDFELCNECGATITLFMQIIKERNIEITPAEATVFMLGIYEDTGSLSFMSTKPEDMEAAASLLRNGVDLNTISQFISRDITRAQLSLLNELVLSSKEYDINNIKVVIAEAHTDDYIGDLAVLTHKLKDMGNLEVLFCVVKMRERVYIVARSRREEVNVGEITKEFGGGGHPTAAAASIRDSTIEETIEKLLSILTYKIKDQIKVRDVMSSPVISIKESTSIEETKKMMLRFNHTGFPVVRDDQVVGIITRQDIDKAFIHGLGLTSVSSYMSSTVITATPETTLQTVHNIMLNHNIGRIPIVNEEKKIIGIVTRTDVLHVLNIIKEKDNFYDKKISQEDRNLAVYLKSRLPHRILEILEKSGEIAEKLGYSVYVVGGFVRDIIMGVKNLDVDLVIEGQGIYFAEKLKDEYNGSIKSHYKFGTAVVVFPDGFKIDVATARTEFYEYPTALPKVESCSIKYDLYRRDFTINALAIKLNSAEFGKLIDFFGGMVDIKKGVVRVLYNLSFIDDPTRIFRAIRFEQRLHFKIDRQTEHFIDNAIKLGMFDKIANQRVRDELILIFSEEKPSGAVRRMAELNILPLIHPKLKFNTKLEVFFSSIFEVCNWFRLLFLQRKVEYWLIYFMAMLNELEEKEVEEILEKFKFTREHMDIIIKSNLNFSKVVKELQGSKNSSPSGIY
ncbi:CBS domain-containing protein, partial [Candidatus Poribacteria bacterium]|nr:CBS domain-containing protein [Candidatus Poribacteria bacterium]